MGLVQSIQSSIYVFVTRHQLVFRLMPILGPIMMLKMMLTGNADKTNWKIFDKKGKFFKCVNFKGRYFPAFGVDRIRTIPDVTIRKSDVILCGYPKTGCHWVHEILSMLVNGKAELTKYGKGLGAFIDMNSDLMIDSLPSPRVLNTHVLYDELPRGIHAQKNKIILTVRNPKDSVVSYFNHIKSLSHFYGYEGEFTDFYDIFIEGKIEYGSYFDYYLHWDEYLKKPESHPILLVRFEDNKADPVGCVKKIAEFLEIDITDEFAAAVAANTSITKMKEKRAGQFGSELLRKGKVGGWTNWLTEAQSREIDQLWQDKMTGLSHQPKY